MSGSSRIPRIGLGLMVVAAALLAPAGAPSAQEIKLTHFLPAAHNHHVNVIVPFIDDGAPVARLTPLGDTQYGLSFHSHTGHWEQMPFVGDLLHLAHDLVTVLGPYSIGSPAAARGGQ